MLELFVIRQLESIHNVMPSAQFSSDLKLVAPAEMLLAENENLIASSAFQCSEKGTKTCRKSD